MNSKIAKLIDMGCEMEEAMERFLDDEEFYLECLEKMIYDGQFDRLGTAIDQHRVQEGFDCAHTLKGLAANLGLVSLEQKLHVIVEELRAGKIEGLMAEYRALMEEREKYLEIIS